MTFAVNNSELLQIIPVNTNSRFKQESRNTALSYQSTDLKTITIMPSPTIKYLGVILDESLTFSLHAKAAAAKGLQALGSVRYLRKSSWGIPSHIAHLITFSAILPKMLWASPTWWNGKPGVIDPLNLTYNIIARWITGLPSNTRITKLLQAAHLPPLELYLYYLSAPYAIPILFLPGGHHLTSTPLLTLNHSSANIPGRHILLNLIKDLNIPPLENRKITSKGCILQHKPIHTEKSENEKHIHNTWIKSLPENTVLIYSDGSKMPNGNTGSGWVIYLTTVNGVRQLAQGSCYLGKRAEVYDAELHAVEESLYVLPNILHHSTTPTNVFILIDNQTAIQCLGDNSQNSQYARNAI